MGEIGLDLDYGAGIERRIADLVRIAEERFGSKDILLPSGSADAVDVFECGTDIFVVASRSPKESA